MESVKRERGKKTTKSWDWRMGVVLGLLILGVIGVGYQAVGESELVGKQYRFNYVIAAESGEVIFVTIDPEEKKATLIEWPGNLSIKSRSVGSYKVRELYRLGSYESKPGELVRQKLQGFMKIPVMGYVEVRGGGAGQWKRALSRALMGGERYSSIKRFDSLVLILRAFSYQTERVGADELVRAGVISEEENETFLYQAGRLQQYLGVRAFDWGIGEEGLTAALINESGITGLATDVASFLTNVGMEVVTVRNGEGEEAVTRVSVGEMTPEREERVGKILRNWFGWEEVGRGETQEYRANIVVRIGRDAEELF